MADVRTRELSGSYGAYTFGGDTRPMLTGFEIDEGFEAVTVRFAFKVYGATEGAFETEVAAARAAFRTPRQTLTLTLGATTERVYSQSANTGFDADPRILNETDDHESGRAKRFDVEILIGLPADNVSTNGRRSGTVDVTADASGKRTIKVNGVYTALGAVLARPQLEAEITAYTAAIQAAVDATASWEEVSRSIENVDTAEAAADGATSIGGKTATYDLEFEEILISEAGASGGSLDNPDIARQQLTLTRIDENEEGGSLPPEGEFAPAAGDFPTVEVQFRCNVNAQSITGGDQLKALYDGTIRDYLLEQLVLTYAIGLLVVTRERVDIDPTANTISVTIRAMAPPADGQFLSFKRTERTPFQTGALLVPTWTGDRLSKYVYQGPGDAQIIVEEEAEEVGIRDFNPFDSLTTIPPIPTSGFLTPDITSTLEAILISQEPGKRIDIRGISPNTFEVTIWTRTTTWELVTRPVPASQAGRLG